MCLSIFSFRLVNLSASKASTFSLKTRAYTSTDVNISYTGNITKTRSTQRIFEKRTSRTEVTNKTRALVKKFLIAESSSSRLIRMQELSCHILNFPPTRIVAVQEPRLIADLLSLTSSSIDSVLQAEARQCLTLCGYQPPVKSKGINLLCIDGGGTRGMMGLEVLDQLEKISGKKICDLFDHVVGVSTGSIIASLLTVKKFTVKECREMYMDVSKKLFSQNRLQGFSGLVWSHSYYDTKKWIKILRELIDERNMIETSKEVNVARLSIVSSIVNLPVIQPYIFRNYEPPAGRDSHYRGGTMHPLWQAIQASAAAPLYFEEVQLGSILLQDGGMIANNPTAIAIHEAKLLWPHEKLHCVVSVGNGRTVVELEQSRPKLTSSGLQMKLNRIIDSATDTEAVHMSMHDLLDQNVYFRLNPYMTSPYGLDEINPEKLEQMKNDAKLYIRRNSTKFESVVERLIQEPSLMEKAKRKYENWMDRRGYYRPR